MRVTANGNKGNTCVHTAVGMVSTFLFSSSCFLCCCCFVYCHRHSVMVIPDRAQRIFYLPSDNHSANCTRNILCSDYGNVYTYQLKNKKLAECIFVSASFLLPALRDLNPRPSESESGTLSGLS